MKLTDEQQNVINSLQLGNSLKVQAFAGTGKSSMLAEAFNEKMIKGIYVTFNKAAAEEMKGKFYNGVQADETVFTSHSLAYRQVGKNYKLQLQKKNYKNYDFLKLKTFHIGALKFTPATQWSIILKSIHNLTSSGSEWITKDHICEAVGSYTYSEIEQHQVADQLFPAVDETVTRMCDKNQTALGISHDFYLWLWMRKIITPESRMKFPYQSLVVVDEAQDSNGSLLNLLVNLENQICFVGDAYQQIYEWRGARNAIQSLDLPEMVLSKSFRMTDKIAKICEKIIGREIVGTENPPDNIPGWGILCRRQFDVIKWVLTELDAGRTVALDNSYSGLFYDIEEMQRFRRGIISKWDFYGNYDSLVAHISEFPDDEETKQIYLLEKFLTGLGIEPQDIKNKLTNPHYAEVEVSTIHRAKGRQWQSVDLDLALDRVSNPHTPEIQKLIYVGCSRASEDLDFPTKSDKDIMDEMTPDYFIKEESVVTRIMRKKIEEEGRPVAQVMFS